MSPSYPYNAGKSLRLRIPASRLSAAGWRGVIFLASLIHIGYYYPRLPDRMASHLGPDGRADGWMGKLGFAVFYIAMMALQGGVCGALSAFLHRIPDSQINLPHKGYWLAPERRAATLRDMGQQPGRLGIAVTLFLMAAVHQVIKTNLRGGDVLGGLFFVRFALFLGFVGVQTIGMMRRYGRIPEE